MSYGTRERFPTKKALREAVEQRGAGNIKVFGTSGYGNELGTTVADLAGTTAVIVGPDVNNDRRWYANVKLGRDGFVKIV